MRQNGGKFLVERGRKSIRNAASIQEAVQIYSSVEDNNIIVLGLINTPSNHRSDTPNSKRFTLNEDEKKENAKVIHVFINSSKQS